MCAKSCAKFSRVRNVCVQCTKCRHKLEIILKILDNFGLDYYLLWLIKLLVDICTLCPKKRPPFYFSNNFVKNLPIIMIFGVLNPEKNLTSIAHLPTSPVYCSHFSLGNSKSHFSSLIHTYFRLFMLSQKKTNCYSLTTTPVNVTALPCKMHKFFIFFIFLTRIDYQSAIWMSCGSVATWAEL